METSGKNRGSGAPRRACQIRLASQCEDRGVVSGTPFGVRPPFQTIFPEVFADSDLRLLSANPSGWGPISEYFCRPCLLAAQVKYL